MKILVNKLIKNENFNIYIFHNWMLINKPIIRNRKNFFLIKQKRK